MWRNAGKTRYDDGRATVSCGQGKISLCIRKKGLQIHLQHNTLLSPPQSTWTPLDSTEVHLKVEGLGEMESSPVHSTQVYSSPLKGTRGNGVHSSPVHSTQVQTSPLKGRGGNGVQSSPLHSTPLHSLS